MNRIARDYVLSIFTESIEDIAILPGFDCALSSGEIMDFGRIIKCKLDWDVVTVVEAADEFGNFAESLFEIGDWYSNSEEPYGSEPDEEFMAVEDTMDVWRDYIAGFDFSSDITERKNLCELNNITGFAPEILLFMANRYCKFSSIDAPSIVLDNALEELASAFLINKFASEVERIDMLMDERIEESYFKECKDLSLSDFHRIAHFYDDTKNIHTNKEQIFYEATRTDDDVKKLYFELLRM